MKNQLLLIPALLFCINAAAQNTGGRITGIVVDEAEDTPLTGASIVLKEIQEGKVADIDGKFTFSNLPEATYTVLVDLIGYDPQEKTVRVEKGKTSSLLICLKEQPLSLEQATVTAKSEARKVREQAMPVSVISMKQLQGTVSDIQGILAKTVGVTVRSTGGAVNIVLKEYPDHLAWPSNTTTAWCISHPSAWTRPVSLPTIRRLVS